MPVAHLLDRDLWTAATEHPFLVAVRDGSLHESAFDTWLVQDHLFVEDLLWFQSRLLARAPDAARAVLAGVRGVGGAEHRRRICLTVDWW